MKRYFKKIIVIGWVVFLLSAETVMAQASFPADVEYLRAVAADAKVTLSWRAVAEATGYKIYMGTKSVTNENDSYDLPIISVGNVTEYLVNGLTNGTIYYFALTAVNEAGTESAHYSYEVRAQPTAASGTPPDFESPSDVETVTAIAGDAQATLKWSAATDNIAVTGYKINLGTKSVTQEGDSYNLPVITVGNVTEYEVKNLTNSLTYYFAITAFDVAGNESIYYSDEVNALPKEAVQLDSVAPSDVEGVKLTEGDQKVTLKWTAATDNTRVAGYKIYMGTKSVTTADDSYDLPTLEVGNVTEYEIKDLKNGTKYYFAITAFDAMKNESLNYSDEASGTPQAAKDDNATPDDNGNNNENDQNTGNDDNKNTGNDDNKNTGGDANNSGSSGDNGNNGNSGNNSDDIHTGGGYANPPDILTKNDDQETEHGVAKEDPISVNNEDQEPPEVLYASFMDKNIIRLIFSETVVIREEDKAKDDIEIFKIANLVPLAVTKVILEEANPKIVTVSTEGMEEGTDYVVRISKVMDAVGNMIKEDKTSTATFSTPAQTVIQSSIDSIAVAPPEGVANVNEGTENSQLGSGQSGLANNTAALPTSGPELWVILAIGAMVAGRWVGRRE